MTLYTNGIKKQELYTGQTTNGQNPDISGLIAHYTMDSISGTTLVEETGSYNGTLINNPTQVDGYIGKALDFDPASTQYVDCGAAMGNALGNGVSALSVSMWFKADNTSINNGLFHISNFDFTQGEFRIGLNIDTLIFRMSDAAFQETTPFTDTTAWHHLIAMYTGTRGISYLDNIKVIDELHGTNLNLSGLRTSIAAVLDANFTFDGKIDQVRIFDKALTTAEINQLCSEKVGRWLYENGKEI